MHPAILLDKFFESNQLDGRKGLEGSVKLCLETWREVSQDRIQRQCLTLAVLNIRILLAEPAN
jgi:hypothetical protein